jgi:hypothetical protein
MRKLISLTMTGVLAMGLGVGISGCTEEAGTKPAPTTAAPGGMNKGPGETKAPIPGESPSPGKPGTP